MIIHTYVYIQSVSGGIVNILGGGSMVSRRIFGPRRDEVTGEWRRLHNEELNDLYS